MVVDLDKSGNFAAALKRSDKGHVFQTEGFQCFFRTVHIRRIAAFRAVSKRRESNAFMPLKFGGLYGLGNVTVGSSNGIILILLPDGFASSIESNLHSFAYRLPREEDLRVR